jgi:hypothetical protein
MNAMRKHRTAEILALIGLASAAMYLWRDRNDHRARADTLQLRVAMLEAEAARDISPPPVQTSSSSGSRNQSQDPAAPAQTSTAALAPAPTSSGSEVADPTEDAMAFERRMLAIPEYREGRKAQHRRELARLRNEGIQVVGITPEQADRIIETMVERSLDWSSRPNPRNAQEELERLREIEEKHRKEEADLRALLGDAKAEQWTEFIASQSSRSEVRRLRDSLSDGSEPLRDDQVEPLISALHTVRTQFQKEMQDYRDSLASEGNRQGASAQYAQRYTERMAAADKRAAAEAASILSQQQLAAFQAMRARQLEIQIARQRLRETQANDRQPPTAKSP